MIQIFIGVATAFILTACATLPRFQKSLDGSNGFTVQDLSTKDHFRVTVQVPPESSGKFIKDYGFRAVGEECLARGFHYFDVGEISLFSFEGFCFADAVRKSLAITFQPAGLLESPPRFIVGNLNNKTNSKLQVNDEIVFIDQERPNSMSQLKSIVFAASNKKQLSMKIKRQNNEIAILEPIVELRDAAYGKNDLEALRVLVR